MMAKQQFKGSVMLNPVPVVLVTSVNSDGTPNVFTVAWAGVACTKPPMVTIAIRPERLSFDNISANGEFVINLPGSNLVKAVDYCGVKSGRTNDKLREMNLTTESCKVVSVPMIAQCPVAMECIVKSITPLGTHHLFLAEVVNVNVEEHLISSEGKIHFEKADLLVYSHGEYFKISQKPLGSFGYSVRKFKKKN